MWVFDDGSNTHPIARRGKCDCLSPHPIRVQFWRVDPRYRAPGRSIGGDKEIGAGDDGFGCRARHTYRRFFDAVNAIGARVCAVAGEDSSVGEEPGGHERGADQQGGSSAHAIDVEERGHSHDYVYHVLD